MSVLTNSYENNSCDFYRRTSGGCVPWVVRTEEGSASGHFHCRDDSWHGDDQEELDHQEDVDRFG